MVAYISVYVSTNASVNRDHMNVDCSNTVAASLPQEKHNMRLSIEGLKKKTSPSKWEPTPKFV